MDKNESTAIWKEVCIKNETDSILKRRTDSVNQF
jgi:hypothetical protein